MFSETVGWIDVLINKDIVAKLFCGNPKLIHFVQSEVAEVKYCSNKDLFMLTPIVTVNTIKKQESAHPQYN